MPCPRTRQKEADVVDIEQALARLGIVGNLYKVYRAAIELGDVPVARVIERCGLPKATVYGALTRLEQEGLIADWGQPGKRRVVAYDPAILLEQLEARRQMLGEMLPQLRSLYNAAKGKPGIRFYEGLDGVEKALWDSLTTTSGEMYCTFAMAEIIEVPGLARMADFQAERLARGIDMKVMRSRGLDRQDIWSCSRAERRELRFSPDNAVLAMTMLIYDTRVAVVSSSKESYGLVIESGEFSSLLRTMFMSVWAISERVPFIEDLRDDSNDRDSGGRQIHEPSRT
jgi:sugar-specific transcriptional regulator TrmB